MKINLKDLNKFKKTTLSEHETGYMISGENFRGGKKVIYNNFTYYPSIDVFEKDEKNKKEALLLNETDIELAKLICQTIDNMPSDYIFESLKELDKLVSPKSANFNKIIGDLGEMKFIEIMYINEGKNIIQQNNIEELVDFEGYEIKSIMNKEKNFSTSAEQLKQKPKYIIAKIVNDDAYSINEYVKSHPLSKELSISRYKKYFDNEYKDVKIKVHSIHEITEELMNDTKLLENKGLIEAHFKFNFESFKSKELKTK